MNIDDELVLKLENLAKLRLSDGERLNMKSDLGKIADMFSSISKVNTDGVEPLIHMTDAINVFRNDVSETSLDLDYVKRNAPIMVKNHFAVPKVIE